MADSKQKEQPAEMPEKKQAAAKKVVKKRVAKKKVASKSTASKKSVAVKKKVAAKKSVKKSVARKATVKKRAAASGGTAVEINQRDRYEMIAKMAYFRAEKRGFEPGWEQEDWLQSERLVDEMLSKA